MQLTIFPASWSLQVPSMDADTRQHCMYIGGQRMRSKVLTLFSAGLGGRTLKQCKCWILIKKTGFKQVFSLQVTIDNCIILKKKNQSWCLSLDPLIVVPALLSTTGRNFCLNDLCLFFEMGAQKFWRFFAWSKLLLCVCGKRPLSYHVLNTIVLLSQNATCI
jgi:hypothetical protein